MHALVTGGTGFLGSPVVARLKSAGWRVRTFGRGPAGSVADEHVRGDIRNQDRLREALEGIDSVLHFAWSSVPQTSNENPRLDLETNLTAGVALLEACCEAGVKYFVFPSSGGAVYGMGRPEPFEETCVTDPVCAYGITKLAFEKYLALYRRLHGLDYRVLRIANAYGEGQPTDRPQGLIGIALDRALKGEPLTVWGDGSAVRDYVYVGDVANGCVSALQALPEDAPRIFNLSSAEGHSVRDILAAVERTTGRSLNRDPKPARSCDADRVVLANRRAREVLGWAPRVPLEEGLLRAWDHVSLAQA